MTRFDDTTELRPVPSSGAPTGPWSVRDRPRPVVGIADRHPRRLHGRRLDPGGRAGRRRPLGAHHHHQLPATGAGRAGRGHASRRCAAAARSAPSPSPSPRTGRTLVTSRVTAVVAVDGERWETPEPGGPPAPSPTACRSSRPRACATSSRRPPCSIRRSPRSATGRSPGSAATSARSKPRPIDTGVARHDPRLVPAVAVHPQRPADRWRQHRLHGARAPHDRPSSPTTSGSPAPSRPTRAPTAWPSSTARSATRRSGAGRVVPHPLDRLNGPQT